MKSPAPVLSLESFAQLPRREALVYLKSRCDKIRGNMSELKRFKAFSSQNMDEQFDQHVIMSNRCQDFLEQAMVVFPSHREFRKWAGLDSFAINNLVPQGLSNTAYSEDRYTKICNWVSEGLSRVSKRIASRVIPEVEMLTSLVSAKRHGYSDFISESKLFPEFLTEKGYRDIFLFKTVFTSSLHTGIKKTAAILSTEQKHSSNWSRHLDDYRKMHPENWNALAKEIEEHMWEFNYSHTMPLREYIGMPSTPSDNECRNRFWRHGQHILEGVGIDQEDFTDTLKAIQINKSFFNVEFPRSVQGLIYARANLNSDVVEEIRLADSTPDQILKLVEMAEITSDDLIDLGLICIGGLDHEGPGNSIFKESREEKAGLLISTYVEHSEHHFNAHENRADLPIYLLVKTASPELIDTIASTNDISASICYEITRRPELLKGIKDKRHVDRAFSADLGL